MNGRGSKNGKNASSTLPAGENPGPGARIEIAPPPEIDITKDRLGAVLSGRRHMLGLKIDEVAEDIKVRPEYLRALEQEAMDKLPTPQYARLFLKAYSQRLGLNVQEVYALYDLCEHPPQEEVQDQTTPQPREAAAAHVRRSGRWIWWVVGGIILVAAVATWALLRARVKSSGPTGAVSPASPTAGAGEGNGQFSAEPAEATMPRAMDLVLTFDRDARVVLAADGDTVVNQVMHRGGQARAGADDRFVLTLDPTAGVVATVNGQPLRPFQSRAPRLTSLVVTADSVEAWLDQSAATAAPGGGTTEAADEGR